MFHITDILTNRGEEEMAKKLEEELNTLIKKLES